jgi:hypothetical protein
VIENQFEKTNHDHLGKIITYAAGLKAATVVWVAETFTDEHRQALDWLNENAGENLAFFGLQVELWRIGDSMPAPQFKIVSSPNEWTRAVNVNQPREVTDTKMDQLHFWEEVRDCGRSRGMTLPFRRPRPQHWYDIAVGRSGFWIALSLNSFNQHVRCALVMRGPQVQAGFDVLENQKEAIETEIGQKLEWRRERGHGGSMISIAHTGLLIEDSRQREEAKTWLVDMAGRFHKTFAPRVQALRLNVTNTDDEEDNNA